MDDHDWLTQQFEGRRTHLRAVAYRMLGSLSEADDAVQESWLRLSRANTSSVENLGGWLTTVVARVCLDMLRTRATRREEPLEASEIEPMLNREDGIAPEQEAIQAESVGLALLVVLDTLNPAERLAFVLHDLFDVPFDEIAPIVGRSPTAARQLASRARRRIRGAGAATGATQPDADLAATLSADDTRQRTVVGAFFAASRAGNFDALLALLDPDVVLSADRATVQMGATAEISGAQAVAQQFAGNARAARLALVNGAVGAVWSAGGQPRVVFGFTITDEKIVAIDLISDPESLQRFDLVILDG